MFSPFASGGMDFKTILSIVAIAASGLALYTAYAADNRSEVSDLRGSVQTLTANVNERPDAEAVRQIVADEAQPLIDEPTGALRETVASLEARIDELQTALDGRPDETGVQSIAEESGVPAGAIVAFAGSCPVHLGWREYEPARGRFVVGTGTNTDKAGTTRDFVLGHGFDDGVYAHALTIDEMPIHHHRIDRQGPTRGITDVPPLGSDGAIISMIETELSQPAGGDQPHNNLPPYIALRFCEKF